MLEEWARPLSIIAMKTTPANSRGRLTHVIP